MEEKVSFRKLNLLNSLNSNFQIDVNFQVILELDCLTC